MRRLGEEKPAAWYDEVFAGSTKYARHYAKTKYYALWSVVVDRLVRSGSRSVVELGCGSGQFASLLRDKGFRDYLGIDFSAVAVAQATGRCPELSFEVDDVLSSRVLETRAYDAVVCLEVLEHVEEDRSVLERIRPGALVFASVPNFPAAAHVRHFESEREVLDRYGALFERPTVDAHLVDPGGGTKHFLLEGVRLGDQGAW